MDKIKLLKKGGLIALGLASITTKKAESLINDFKKKGKLNKKQGEMLARKVIAETLKEQKKIRTKVLGEVSKSAKKVIGVTQQEAKRLMKQVKLPKAKPKKAKKKKRR